MEQSPGARQDLDGKILGHLAVLDTQPMPVDKGLRVTRMNPAAEKVFQMEADKATGKDFSTFLSTDDRPKLKTLIEELDNRPDGQRYLWIPGGHKALRADGNEFPAEVTLSRYEIQRETYHTLILRNVHDRLELEQKIRSLTVGAEDLKEELKIGG